VAAAVVVGTVPRALHVASALPGIAPCHRGWHRAGTDGEEPRPASASSLRREPRHRSIPPWPRTAETAPSP